ncbi:hypothetical protein P8C59_006013 [Phyllachora maydis]|uniref:Sfi1 spindle body domain-containing protein n=1 Tax=Phyllachora maydis TaxID=1825666 RepID=A0AAD9I6M7_9PEZI|nr:hypothetical protein P8C59_006013 [Phyllachora maydis]
MASRITRSLSATCNLASSSHTATTQTKMIMVDRSKPGVTLITMSLTDTMRAITTWSKSKEQTTHCEMKQSMTTLFVTEKITPAPLSLECLAKPHATQLRRHVGRFTVMRKWSDQVEEDLGKLKMFVLKQALDKMDEAMRVSSTLHERAVDCYENDLMCEGCAEWRDATRENVADELCSTRVCEYYTESWQEAAHAQAGQEAFAVEADEQAQLDWALNNWHMASEDLAAEEERTAKDYANQDAQHWVDSWHTEARLNSNLKRFDLVERDRNQTKALKKWSGRVLEAWDMDLKADSTDQNEYRVKEHTDAEMVDNFLTAKFACVDWIARESMDTWLNAAKECAQGQEEAASFYERCFLAEARSLVAQWRDVSERARLFHQVSCAPEMEWATRRWEGIAETAREYRADARLYDEEKTGEDAVTKWQFELMVARRRQEAAPAASSIMSRRSMRQRTQVREAELGLGLGLGLGPMDEFDESVVPDLSTTPLVPPKMW